MSVVAVLFWPSGSYLKPNETVLDSASDWNDLNTTNTNTLTAETAAEVLRVEGLSIYEPRPPKPVWL